MKMNKVLKNFVKNLTNKKNFYNFIINKVNDKGYFFMKKILLITLFFVYQIYSQDFSAFWKLDATTQHSVTTSGAIIANDQKIVGLAINGWAGNNNSAKLYSVTGGTTQTGYWPNENEYNPERYTEYLLKAKNYGTLNVASIKFEIGNSGGSDNLRADFFYSTDNFITSTRLGTTDALPNKAMHTIEFSSLNINAENGKAFIFRIFLWATNGGATSGKYANIQNLEIKGTTSGASIDLPTISTNSASYISTTFLTIGGKIISDGGANITERGICWNLTGSPTINDNKVNIGNGAGTFSTKVKNLQPNTSYYFRAFATNNAGTAYGNEILVTTLANKTIPIVSTTIVNNILAKSAQSGGSILNWGGDSIIVKGICWSKNQNPTLNNFFTENGKDINSFSSLMNNLEPSTTYYVRAYAVNSIGIGYGNELSFTTLAIAPNIKKIVAQDGSGDFKTVQEAFNNVPDYYTGSWTIFVKKGTYKEKLLLNSKKVNVILEGEDSDETILTYDDYSGRVVNGVTLGTSTSYSVAIDASDFIAKNITFQNTSTVAQAVALRIQGDRHSFYNCKLLGYQDTYYTWGGSGVGRTYMKNCYIEGSVDFIFGRNVVVFDNCIININRNVGTLTAASTDESSKFGYVFLNCKITYNKIGFDNNPITSFYLGRPWQNSPRTVFIRCEEPDALNPQGWLTWNVNPGLYAEYKCFGIGSDYSKRLNISRQLTDGEAKEYNIKNIFSKNTSPTFNENWLPDTTLTTSINQKKENGLIPFEFELYQNYPNPFNSGTKIRYVIPSAAKESNQVIASFQQNSIRNDALNVTLKVYDILGREVATLVNEYQKAGSYSAEFRVLSSELSSGVYFYKIDVKNLSDKILFSQIKKLIILK